MVGAKYFALIFVDPSETEILLDTELFLHISCMFFPMLGLLCILRYTIQGVGYTNLRLFGTDSETKVLGDSAQKYMFILENEKSNPAGIKKSANHEYIFCSSP